MNLSDTSLIEYIHSGQLLPNGEGANDTVDLDKQVQPSTIDLRLGHVFWKQRMGLKHDVSRIINPRVSNPEDYFFRTVVPDGEPFIMYPGAENFVLGATMEFIAVPKNMVGFVDGRSSYGRWGLRIHSTAGLIDAGFRGIITLEIALDNRYPLAIFPGDRICQIRFETLDHPAHRPYGHESRKSKYQNQAGATPSLSKQDGET